MSLCSRWSGMTCSHLMPLELSPNKIWEWKLDFRLKCSREEFLSLTFKNTGGPLTMSMARLGPWPEQANDARSRALVRASVCQVCGSNSPNMRRFWRYPWNWFKIGIDKRIQHPDYFETSLHKYHINRIPHYSTPPNHLRFRIGSIAPTTSTSPLARRDSTGRAPQFCVIVDKTIVHLSNSRYIRIYPWYIHPQPHLCSLAVYQLVIFLADWWLFRPILWGVAIEHQETSTTIKRQAHV